MTKSAAPTSSPNIQPALSQANLHSPAFNRNTTDTVRQSNAFQRELDKASNKAESKNDKEAEKESKAERQPEEGKSRIGRDDGESSGKGDSDQNSQPDMATAEGFALLMAQTARPSKVMATAMTAPEIPPEHLARMAAAIQEMADKGVTARYQLSLPAGPAMIEGAILGQDPAGRISVQLMANAAMPPAMISQLQQSLAQRLRERKLRLGEIEIKTAEQAPQRKSDGGERPIPTPS